MAEDEAPERSSEHTLAFTCLGREVRLHLPDREDHIQRLIAAELGFYEQDMLLDIATRGLPPDGVALDVGANIGNHTVFLAAVLGLRVVALEPLAACREVLERNLELNGIAARVRVLPQAAGASAGRGRMVVEDPRNLGRSSLELGADGDVEVVRLDDLELSGKVALIKVDVERMELDVLRGALSLLARDQPLVYVEAPEPDALVELRRLLGPLGYWHVEQFNFTPTYLFLPAQADAQRFAALMARLQGLEHAVARQGAALERQLAQVAARAEDLGSRHAQQHKGLTAELEAALGRLPLAELRRGQAALREGLSAVVERQAGLSEQLGEGLAKAQQGLAELGRAGEARDLAQRAGQTALEQAVGQAAAGLEGEVRARFEEQAEERRRQAEELRIQAREQRRQVKEQLDRLADRLQAQREALTVRLEQGIRGMSERLVQLDDLLLEAVRLLQLDHRLLEAWLGLPGRLGRLGRPVRELLAQLGAEARGPVREEVRRLRKKVALRTRVRRLAKRLGRDGEG